MRAMASWAVILAIEGFRYYDLAERLSFTPRIGKERFKWILSTLGCWGSLSQVVANEVHRVELEVHGGSIRVKDIVLENLVPEASLVRVH